jgi:hypothetical protein
MAPSLTIRAWLALVLALPLGACTGAPLGEQLSDSFSNPPPGEVAPVDVPTGQQAPPPGASPVSKPPATPRPTPVAAPAAQQPVPLPRAPYRLVLRLPAADPAAPSEQVTEALRAAGVSFEVETIERVQAANSSADPASPPVAPAPAPVPAPTAQPAPAPR